MNYTHFQSHLRFLGPFIAAFHCNEYSRVLIYHYIENIVTLRIFIS